MEKSSYLLLKKNKSNKDRVISLYRDIEIILKTDESVEDLRYETQKMHVCPDLRDVLQKRRNDMENSNHYIIIIGGTSVGKTTLINRIIGKRIFKSRNLKSTSTICQIRNSDRIRIITESKEGETHEIDLTDTCNLATKEGEQTLRDCLTEFTDMTASRNSVNYRSVQVTLPLPFLKGNTALVDTPGFDETGTMTQELGKYFSNAVSFIFVIDAGRPSSMQDIKLSKILKSIILLQTENELFCFDPKDALFISNKWDTIDSDDETYEDASGMDEVTKTWTLLKSDVKRIWPHLREDNIFKMNLIDVHFEKKNISTKQFNIFKAVLESTYMKSEQSRTIRHLRFLQDVIKTISKVLNTKQKMKKDYKPEEDMSVAHIDNLKIMMQECNKVKEKLLERTLNDMESVALDCFEFMSTDFGRDTILNPQDSYPSMSVPSHLTFVEQLQYMVRQHVERFLKTKKVLRKFKDVRDEIISFYHKISLDLSKIENDWTYDQTRPGSVVCICENLVTSPFWLPEFTVDFSTVSMNQKLDSEIQQQAKNDCYSNIIRSIPTAVFYHLKSSYGVIIVDLLDKVTED